MMESSSLETLNELLAYVSYTSTVYHIHTGDLASFQFEDHEGVFPITIKQPQPPVLYDMGTDINSQVTITTKTFLRYPELNRLLKSIRQFYKDIEVIIADDSFVTENINGNHTKHFIMPPGQEGDEMEGGCLNRTFKSRFHSLPGYPQCSVVSGVVNFFLARTDAAKRFFIDGLGSLMVATCGHVSIGHQGSMKHKTNYGRFRHPGRGSGHSVRLVLDNIMKESSFKGRTCFTIFLLLLMTFLIFFQFQPKMSSPIIYPKATTEPPKVRSICNFPPLSPKDALEERLLLESVAWPETPALPSPLSLELTSHPAHSTFTILPARGGQWHVGDQLEVSIAISDFKGQPKKSGGDFLFARLHNLTLGAGVAGKVVDHLNGSYSAVFPLLWEGAAQVEVTLVHPSEAITVLNRLNREQPDRVFFISLFRSGSQAQTTTCNICLRQTKQPICDFTDPRTGDPWFCYKPREHEL
ncbi:hypothetical protein F7725_022082 [Dissostichus mawsoni]|uniref:Uncharacterized protein n=1 Tax=Dissostichus mawsoni TaxID=36200 RepID=A0A7J5ZDL9_DISMA|nr:hypothetical protein F7725_022082 [Dissostichus mawsoni]